MSSSQGLLGGPVRPRRLEPGRRHPVPRSAPTGTTWPATARRRHGYWVLRPAHTLPRHVKHGSTPN